ncbi:acyltransferase domain-containing protein [Streptomyces californicus]|uniref:acyltransferase domain-containing protein n=1 Tax=Streptomyces californicus TaxID=67351 RepID=UPI003821EE81
MADAVRAAVAQAGIAPAALRHARTTVVTAASPGAAGRLAAALRLTGAAISLDDPEAPALLAVHLAAQALRAGDTSYAVVGAELPDSFCGLVLARQSAATTAGAASQAVVRTTTAERPPMPDGRGSPARETPYTTRLLTADTAPDPAEGFPGLLATLHDGTPQRPTAVTEHGSDATTVLVLLDRPQAAAPAAPLPWVVSAPHTGALRATAATLAVHLDAAPAEPADVAHTLLTARPDRRRAAVVGADRATLTDGLRALATGADAPHLVRGTATGSPRPVFVFPGQGSQWPGMAAGLLETSEPFHDSVHACADALAEFVDWSLLDVLRQAPDAPPLHRVDVLQPTLWATMVALAEVWRSYGVEPAAVVGHCYGEIAAAQVAGALEPRDAARLLAHRSRAWLRLVGKGTVISVATSGQDITRRMAAWPDSVELAALNGPRSVALAGPPDVLDAIVADLTGQGVHAKRIPGVETVGHCSHVEGLRDHLLDVLRPVSPRPATVPFYSTVDGAERDTTTLDTDYWYLNTRSQVRFHQAVRNLLAAGHRSFVEVSPHPLLGASIEDTAAELGLHDVAVVGTLRRGQGGTRRVLTSVAEAYVHGIDVDFTPAFTGTTPSRVDLPTVEDHGTEGHSADDSETWTDRVRALPDEQRGEALVDLVCRTVATVLAAEPADTADTVAPDTAFKELGLGSLSAVRLRNSLREATGAHLPTTIAYDHPTPAALARHLATTLFDATGVAPVIPGPGRDHEPIDAETALLTALERADEALERLRTPHARTPRHETGRRIDELLRSLTDKARRMRQADAVDDADDAATDRFAAATDDEMFELLDRRFGIS